MMFFSPAQRGERPRRLDPPQPLLDLPRHALQQVREAVVVRRAVTSAVGGVGVWRRRRLVLELYVEVLPGLAEGGDGVQLAVQVRDLLGDVADLNLVLHSLKDLPEREMKKIIKCSKAKLCIAKDTFDNVQVYIQTAKKRISLPRIRVCKKGN